MDNADQKRHQRHSRQADAAKSKNKRKKIHCHIQTKVIDKLLCKCFLFKRQQFVRHSFNRFGIDAVIANRTGNQTENVNNKNNDHDLIINNCLRKFLFQLFHLILFLFVDSDCTADRAEYDQNSQFYQKVHGVLRLGKIADANIEHQWYLAEYAHQKAVAFYACRYKQRR